MQVRSQLVVAAALAATLLTSCTPRLGPADPFSGGRSPAREGVRRHIVRLEVGCDYCRIRYFVGAESFDETNRQVWSERLDLTPLIPTAIRLSATPMEDGKPIRWTRILVDGEVVAEDGCNNCRDATAEALSNDRRTMSVETTIPRR